MHLVWEDHVLLDELLLLGLVLGGGDHVAHGLVEGLHLKQGEYTTW